MDGTSGAVKTLFLSRGECEAALNGELGASLGSQVRWFEFETVTAQSLISINSKLKLVPSDDRRCSGLN